MANDDEPTMKQTDAAPSAKRSEAVQAEPLSFPPPRGALQVRHQNIIIVAAPPS